MALITVEVGPLTLTPEPACRQLQALPTISAGVGAADGVWGEGQEGGLALWPGPELEPPVTALSTLTLSTSLRLPVRFRYQTIYTLITPNSLKRKINSNWIIPLLVSSEPCLMLHPWEWCSESQQWPRPFKRNNLLQRNRTAELQDSISGKENTQAKYGNLGQLLSTYQQKLTKEFSATYSYWC